MIEVVSVRFNNKGKVYYFDPAGITVTQGEDVIVETAKGIEYGGCVQGNHAVDDTSVVQPLRPVLRVATEHDKAVAQSCRAKEAEAFEYCQKRILYYGLDMKLVDVECGFEGNKILFFFTSDGRVDFRSLVKDLAGVFKTRIELRQIGVRDEAKMLGGLGVCGKQFCCSQFLTEFHPVSIKMAKTQGLPLNPTKISGTCGRLMCCLKYEEAAYEDLVRKAPKQDAFVETPSGKGSVMSVNLLRGNVKVRLEDGMDTTLKTFTFEELDILGGKARRAEYIAAKADGRLEEAGFKPSPPPPPPPLPPEPPKQEPKHQNEQSRERPAGFRQKQQQGQTRPQQEAKQMKKPPQSAKNAPAGKGEQAVKNKGQQVRRQQKQERKAGGGQVINSIGGDETAPPRKKYYPPKRAKGNFNKRPQGQKDK